jgi:hypothetical protein
MSKKQKTPLRGFPDLVERFNNSIGRMFNISLSEKDVVKFLFELDATSTVAGIQTGAEFRKADKKDSSNPLEMKVATIFVMIISLRISEEKGVTIDDAIKHTKQILFLEATLLSA